MTKSLIVEYNGLPAVILNKELLDKQNAWNNLEQIKAAHWLKIMIQEMMVESDDLSFIRALVNDLTVVEYELQQLWGFPLDPTFHRFWEYPKCSCPVLYNQ